MRSLLALALCLGVSTGLSAGTISYTGQWTHVDANHDGIVNENWVFNLGFQTTGATHVTFDMLAGEIPYWPNRPGTDDWNHDGQLSRRDTFIRLYETDIFGNRLQEVAANDDAGANDLNGSIDGYDSFLTLNLGAGLWSLAIGQYYLNQLEVAQGFQSARDDGPFRIDVTSDLDLVGIHSDHDVSPTPEASTIVLTLAGTLALSFGL